MPSALARWTGWPVELLSLACCVALVVEDRATIHAGAPHALVGWATVVIVISHVVVLASRAAPPLVGPILLALLAPGLLLADAARTTVLGLALAVLLPVTVLVAVGTRTRSVVFVAPTAAAVASGLARQLARDPFRERRCLPACVTNPDLITRAPDAVRVSEVVLGVVSLAVVPVVARRVWTGRRWSAIAAASLALCVLLAVWAVRLLQQPRPAPDDATDRRVFVIEVVAVVFAAVAHAWAASQVMLTRRRIRRFTRSLSDAGDLDAIAARIRTVVGEPDLEVELGDGALRSGVATEVIRGGRTVASIRHRPGSRGRVAAAVTPSIALALETQLVLREAEAQVAELERSRATSVRTTDDARRGLERNLHDGAQQRLLVIGMQLANAAGDDSSTDTGRRIAAGHVAEALQELRRIGRGDAAIIAELGLSDAVTSLAGLADVTVRARTVRCPEPGHDCWPLGPATTAYRLLVAAVVEAQQGTANAVSATFACLGIGCGHAITIEHDGTSPADRSASRDRVLAGGGRIDAGYPTGPTLKAWLP